MWKSKKVCELFQQLLNDTVAPACEGVGLYLSMYGYIGKAWAEIHYGTHSHQHVQNIKHTKMY